MMQTIRFGWMALLLALLLFVAACGGAGTGNTTGNGYEEDLAAGEEMMDEDEEDLGVILMEGTVEIDGSSTVYPLTEAIAEKFNETYPQVRVPVGVSGTGGGFKRFCTGETAISNASRTIKDEEAALCEENMVDYIELAVAYDGLSVLVNPQNDWVDHLTVAELKAIFEPESKVSTWKDVRSEWPAEKITIFSPGADSGTFDYFTEVITGKSKAMRNDPVITFSEDDNLLVQGIAGNKGAIGFFGYAYYEENKDKLKLVPVDGGSGPVIPTEQTINDGSYSPLSRPLYIYVSQDALQSMEVYEFATFYLHEVPALASEVGYIPLPADMYEEGLALIE